LAAVAALALSAFATSAAADTITGAGATFPQPVYTRWAEQYAAQGGDTLNYQGIGSGAGQNQIINRTVDFGASDAPVAADRLATNNLLQFPAVIGAVVVSVNVPGIDGNALRLSGPLVAQIYRGQIRMWNDRRIAALNPSLHLPAIAIAPIYRADASGTTSIFTTYLSAVDEGFHTAVGAGTSVSWPTGVGAPGNAGVAGAISNTRGGLGYIEYAYATENNMPVATLQNRSGQFVRPTMAAFAAAADAADWAGSATMSPSMLNTEGAANWPIVSATYVLLPMNPTDGARSRKVMQFFDWSYRNGQSAAEQLHYVMLPPSVVAQVRQRWCQVQVDGHPVWSGCNN
jgi:phosphate transport system substrate-binding protein